jgi:hypothetical protein
MYPETARWLVGHTQKSDRIGYYEPGIIAFYSGRRFVDPMGLATPGQAGRVRDRDTDSLYRADRPEFVLCLQERTEDRAHWKSAYCRDPDQKPWFKRAYAYADEIVNEPFRVAIFRRI